MERLAIIADDLTGAADAGVRFARQGLATIVTWGAEESASLPRHHSHHRPLPDADVLVFNTDSRALTAEEAYASARKAAMRLKEAGYRHVYKKIDSTLRGQWGAEIDAVMDVFGYGLAIVAPAFPRLGRTTAAGIHYLHGVPVAETEIARDPKCPVGDSDLVRLLSAQTKRPVGLVRCCPASETEPSVSAVAVEAVAVGEKGQPTAIREQAERLSAQGVQLLVCDAQTDDDLARIAAAFADRAQAVLWVGSAGLAEYWPGEPALAAPSEGEPGCSSSQTGPAGASVPAGRPVPGGESASPGVPKAWDSSRAAASDAPAASSGGPGAQSASTAVGKTGEQGEPDESGAPAASGSRAVPGSPGASTDAPAASSDAPVLLVAGSVSGVSAEQIARLKRAPRVAGVEFDPSAAAGGTAAVAAEIARCRDEVARAIADGRDVAFHVAATPAAVAASRAAASARGVSPAELAAAISSALGEVAAAIVGGHRLAGLILTGGDTAIAVCRALSAGGLRLVAELEPGIPLNALAGGVANGLPAVTKAGAFGTPDTFVHALEVLKGERPVARPGVAR